MLVGKKNHPTLRFDLAVTEPFRLDLTVSVLRRLSTNMVDILTEDGRYVRALGGVRRPVVVLVTQRRLGFLDVTVEGGAADQDQALASVRRMLGVDRDLSGFGRAAKKIPWLRPLEVAMRGVKPPRYPTLWEACVNAIVFQQVSLVAASSILGRIIAQTSEPFEHGDLTLHAFPSVDVFMHTSDATLRGAGLSASKLAALRRAAAAIGSGDLSEAFLESLPSPEAAAALRRIKGIGPWTATVILLRGLGRLDVFPRNDSSVAANLAAVAGPGRLDVDDVLATLGTQRGMLYYHLLLARLKARGDIGRTSTAFRHL